MDFEVPHLALDIETLGLRENAVITALSAVIWNFEYDKDITYKELFNRTFYVKLDAIDQIKRFKRITDKETIAWWKTQPQEVQAMSIKASPDDIKVDDALVMLRDYIQKHNFDFNKSYIWTRGIAYDIPKIETLIDSVSESEIKNSFNKDFNDKTPKQVRKLFNNYRARDIRTYCDLIGNSTNGKTTLPKELHPKQFIEHHAQHDIALDVYKMLHIYHE